MIKGSVNPKQSLEGSVIPRGYDGISPTVSVTDIEGGHRITVKDIEGEKFIDVLDGEKGDPFTYADFTPEQLANLKGEPGYTPVKGKDYFDGEDGYTPVKGKDYFDGQDGYTPQKNVDYFDGKDGVSASHRWDGTVLTVTSAAGTSSADLKGEAGYTPQKGIDYFDGEDGYTPQKGVDYNDGVSVTHEWDGTVLRVTSASGTSSVDLKGEQGTGVTILGSYDTEDALNAAHPTGNIGDSYLVNGSLYVWSETENKWINVGNIKGEPGYTPVKGVDYFDGKDGYTPVKGVDYFDGEDGYTPQKGVDYFDGKKGDTGDPGYTPQKGIDYFDGQNGTDGNGIKSVVLNADYTLTLTFDDGTTYTTQSIRGATGNPGKDGSNGTDGVGIASIKQTTTSTEDEGNNVFTVTLTNGESATFTVQNGSKGSKGDKGDTGEVDYSRLNNYLPLAGGTMTGELKVNGGDVAGGSKIVLINGKGQITASGTQTLFGFTAESTIAVGHSSFILAMRGSGTRPKYNSKDVALLSDIPTAVATASANGLMSAADKANLDNLVAKAVSVLSGTAAPAASVGNDGDIYLVTG